MSFQYEISPKEPMSISEKVLAVMVVLAFVVLIPTLIYVVFYSGYIPGVE